MYGSINIVSNAVAIQWYVLLNISKIKCEQRVEKK